MGDKYMVVVDHEFLLVGRTAQLSARGASGSHNDVLAAQRLSLEQLGDTLIGRVPVQTPAAISSMGRVDVGTPLRRAQAQPAQARYTVLEAIGALVLDEDDVPSSTLAGIAGVSVFPNSQFDAPSPVSAASVSVPDPWHRDHVGVQLGHQHTGRNVLIGVLDTGIDAAHAEFSGKMIQFKEFDSAGRLAHQMPRDAGDHGTHVCGLIAGATSGIAPGADLAVAAVLTTPGPRGLSGSAVQIATGLNWLLTHEFRPGRPGVDVVNVSLGVGVPEGGTTRSGYYPFLEKSIRTALLAPGVLVIAAIGNDGSRGEGFHSSPGNYAEVLAIGATDRNDRVADFSDWDSAWTLPGQLSAIKKPEISAPGVGVVSAKPGGGYQAMSGTSMATPIVTGVAALLLEKDPTLVGDPRRLRSDIIARATVQATPSPPNLGGVGRVRV